MAKFAGEQRIADYIREREGRTSCTTRTVRSYINRKDDPLPVRRAGREVIGDSAIIDRWLDEEATRRERRRARAA